MWPTKATVFYIFTKQTLTRSRTYPRDSNACNLPINCYELTWPTRKGNRHTRGQGLFRLWRIRRDTWSEGLVLS